MEHYDEDQDKAKRREHRKQYVVGLMFSLIAALAWGCVGYNIGAHHEKKQIEYRVEGWQKAYFFTLDLLQDRTAKLQKIRQQLMADMDLDTHDNTMVFYSPGDQVSNQITTTSDEVENFQGGTGDYTWNATIHQTQDFKDLLDNGYEDHFYFFNGEMINQTTPDTQ